MSKTALVEYQNQTDKIHKSTHDRKMGKGNEGVSGNMVSGNEESRILDQLVPVRISSFKHTRTQRNTITVKFIIIF